MSTLIKCIECENKLSSSLENCPHCNRKPFPEVCRLCETTEKPSKLANGFHASCLIEIQNTNKEYADRPCPVCAHSLNVSISDKACPQCGHPISRTACYFCLQPLFWSVARRHSVWYVTTPWDTRRETEFHPNCLDLSLARAKSKRVLSPHYCKLCRQWISKQPWYEQLFKSDPHANCEFSLFEDEIYDKPEIVAKNYVDSFIN